MQKGTEDRRQRTEDRRQRTEDRRQRTEQRAKIKWCFIGIFLFSFNCLSREIERILLVNTLNNFSIYAPFIKEEDLISAKDVLLALKGQFDWNPVLQEAFLKKDGVKCFVWVNKNRAILDKKEVILSQAPKLIASSIFIPIELVSLFAERFNIALEVSEEKIVFKEKRYENTKDGFWHVLKDGETLYRISQNYGVDISSILSLNKIIDPRFLIPGTLLYIPALPPANKEEGTGSSVLEKKPKKEINPFRNNRIKRIVLDPGHGGKDPGAIGKTGLKEKDVVLEITLGLLKELRKSLSDIEFILTRDADFYIPLSERTALANFKNADLFISIHANAAFSQEASGFEVYHLSAVASDKYSNELAEAENIVTKRFGEKEQDLTHLILKDIAQTEFINESIDLSLEIQNRVCDGLSMKKRGIKSAFFYVLRGAKMPAILIETGFLSNYEEEARMKQEAFKQSLISAIANAIVAYKEQYENKF